MKHMRIISIILLAAISCSYVCSCDKGIPKGDTISSDSLWYDSERITMELFPDNKDVNVFEESIDYDSEQIRVFCCYAISPTEEEMLSEDVIEANESSSKEIIDDLILDLTADSVYHLSNARC